MNVKYKMATALGVTFCGKFNCMSGDKDEKIKTNKERIKELEDDLEDKYYNREVIDEKNNNIKILINESSRDIMIIKNEMEKIQEEMKKDFEKIHKEVKEDIDKLRSDVKDDIEKIYTKLTDNTIQLATLKGLLERILFSNNIQPPPSPATMRKRFFFI